jgi:hypothetical protein
MVRSQIASLTPGPSFAHNLGCRCPNGQCEAIFDIYVSIPFQSHQEHPNARCFGPFCRALNIWESRRTPNPNFSECWASPPHLAKVGLRQTHKTHHSLDFGEATTFPLIIYSMVGHGAYIQMVFLSRDSRVKVPKLCQRGLLRIWSPITL